MDLTTASELDFEKVLKETKKAYQVRFDSMNICWLPKSQVRILNNKIYMEYWLVREHQLEAFVIPEIFIEGVN